MPKAGLLIRRFSVFAGRRGSENARRKPNTDNRKPAPMPGSPAKLVAAAHGRCRAEQYWAARCHYKSARDAESSGAGIPACLRVEDPSSGGECQSSSHSPSSLTYGPGQASICYGCPVLRSLAVMGIEARPQQDLKSWNAAFTTSTVPGDVRSARSRGSCLPSDWGLRDALTCALRAYVTLPPPRS